jgi:hypothetical protein
MNQYESKNESLYLNTYPENSFKIPFSRRYDQSYTIRPEIDQQHVIIDLTEDDDSNDLNANHSYKNQYAQEQYKLI